MTDEIPVKYKLDHECKEFEREAFRLKVLNDHLLLGIITAEEFGLMEKTIKADG